jgi:hypothetical protein
LLVGLSSAAANLPSDWQHEQPLDIAAAGLVKISLPVETLDSARPALEDLRLYDDAGNEIPFLVERPAPAPKAVQEAKSFRVALNPDNTVIPLETGLSQPLDAVTLETPANNPDFHAPEVLPGVELAGAALDISQWGFRKPVKISAAGAQQVELDPDVLSHARADFADLRLLRGSNQLPYLLQRTSISRWLTPAAAATNDSKQPGLSRWILTLPRAGLPFTRLTCAARTPLFERSMSLYEQLADERGTPYRHLLGTALWKQTPERKSKDFALVLDSAPRSGTFFLETENGDNPPVELEQFQMAYPVTSILFKAWPGDQLFLYYGQERAAPPRYDLSLVAGQMLAAEKNVAQLSAEEPLKRALRDENQAGQGGIVFWGILAAVIVVLLLVISRLLPKPQPASSAPH